jgi:pre-mRNA-splicing helicase BRR2
MRRCVYVVPLESLAKERFADWSKKFGEGLGLTVVELTGALWGPDLI